MKTITFNCPDKMAELIETIPTDDDLDFKKAAFFLYAYIDAGKMSHGKAAELLGVDKFELIDFYNKYGLKYSFYDYTKKENQLFKDFGII